MTPRLKEFLTAWLEWVERGAPPFQPFNRSTSLCYAVDTFANDKDEADDLAEEMEAWFKTTGHDESYPFNDCDRKEWHYNQEKTRGFMHLNERRVSWVRQMIAREPIPSPRLEA